MDKIEILGERLKKVAEGLRSMKTFGIGEEILTTWLQVKLKVSQKQAKKIIKCEEEFFNELIKTEMIKELEK